MDIMSLKLHCQKNKRVSYFLSLPKMGIFKNKIKNKDIG